MMFAGRYSGAAILLFGVLTGSCAAAIAGGKITAVQARSVADHVLAPTEFSNAEATFVQLYDDPENRCLDFEHPDPDYMANVKDIKMTLAGHSYYLVMYESPKDTLFGSSICFFIDETNGEVLGKGRF